jgi:ATP-dependent exoDNAse (exonuclease V) alpha subunit
MLVVEAACRPDRVVCVVGVAGSGKTLALGALADTYRRIDAAVLGAAPSGRAADELERATGIRSQTIHRLLLDAHRDGGLPRGCLVVVDEAGMADTRVLAPLLRLVDRAEGKLLLVGDPAQLPAVGAGGLYQALCERLETVELTGNRRQRDPLEREALARLREGDAEPYLAHTARHGRLTIDENPEATKERLIGDWWLEARYSPTRNVMLAYHRHDVDELNRAAHALMLRKRQLGGEAVTLGEREYRVGEQVLCRRNDGRFDLRNGIRGTVVGLDDDGLIVRGEATTERRIPFGYAAEHLDYGYALTGHAAQGLTVDRAYVLLHDQGALQEWGYVACSRARLETRVYLADGNTLERETPLRQPALAGAPERATRALQQSAAESLAFEQGRPRRDTILNFLNQELEKLDRQRRHAARQLTAAERELRQLRRWSFGRRAELETGIALHKRTLERADAKAEQLRNRVAGQNKTLARAHERGEPTPRLRADRPERTRTARLDREPRGLGLEL